MNETKNLAFLMLIAERKLKDELLTQITEAGGRLVNTVYGKGSVKASLLKDMLGLVSEENKVVITCLARGEDADSILGMLEQKFSFNKPNTGIAFTVPVENLAF